MKKVSLWQKLKLKRFRFWRKFVPVHSCALCYFLTKTKKGEVIEDYSKTWSKYDRINLHIIDETHFAHCYHNVWEIEYPEEHPNAMLEELTKNRRNQCYFFKFDTGIQSFQTAINLMHTQSENQKFVKTNKLIVIGIVTTAVLGFLSIITQLILHYLKQNPNTGP